MKLLVLKEGGSKKYINFASPQKIFFKTTSLSSVLLVNHHQYEWGIGMTIENAK